MSGVLFIFFLRLLMLLYSVSSLNQNFNGNINLWPKPWKIQFPNNVPQSIPLSSSFKIKFPNHNRFLNAAVRRYHRLILTEKYHPVRPPFSFTKNPQLRLLNILRISVSDLWTPLKIDMDESYNLSISSSGRSVNANLMAETVWGAMRGLETFSQLTWGEDPVMIFADVLIWDKPLFSHRGILLVTSRNFYRVKDIKRTIMAMSWNKLNVFHWHITDSHSFPIVLPSEPDLAAKGAYSSKMQYSPNDVKQIIQFGMEHGVRVMPEIDTPGHTGSWAEAYPEIVTCSNMDWWPPGTQWQDRLASEPGTGQLNPLHPKTYQVLHNVLRDVADLFPEQFLHIGYDEVIPGCWKVDPNIRTFLSNTNSSLSTLLEIFFNSTHSFVVSLKKIPVYWEDVLLDPIIHLHPSLLPRSTTILQTWNNGPANTKLLVQLGFRTIVSSSEFYYLDCGHGGFVGNDSRYDRQTSDEPGEPFNYQGGNGGSWCAPFKTWQRIYDYDITHGLSKEEAELVLGGEVAMWSEQADPTVLDSRIWPRASAMAEALWSGNRDDNGKKRYGEALDRLNEWRERLVGRGIKAEPLQPLWCLTHPGMCNVHNTQ